MAKTKAQVYKDEYVTEEGLAYWKTLSKDEQEFNKERVLLFETYKGYELEAMAINAAWARSPTERIRTRVADEVVRNTLWTCYRTGKVLTAKHCIITGDQAASFESLSKEERAFLNADQHIKEVEAHDAKITHDNIKTMLEHCKQTEQAVTILNGLLETNEQLNEFACYMSMSVEGNRDGVISRIVEGYIPKKEKA